MKSSIISTVLLVVLLTAMNISVSAQGYGHRHYHRQYREVVRYCHPVYSAPVVYCQPRVVYQEPCRQNGGHYRHYERRCERPRCWR